MPERHNETMARKSKLTPEQWAQIEARLPTEGASVLGREFGISEAAIRKKFGSHESISSKSAKVREVAQMLADAHTELAKLPEQQRPTAISLADQLRKVAQNFSAMAVNCSETASIVSAGALTVARKVNMEDPMTSQEDLQSVAALSRVATEAASPGLQFLRIMVPGMPDDSKQAEGVVDHALLISLSDAMDKSRENRRAMLAKRAQDGFTGD